MKMTRIAAVGLIAASLSVAGFAGCGSSSSSSSGSDTAAAADTTAADTTATDGGASAEFVAAANQACADLNSQLDQLAANAGDNPTVDDLKQVVSDTADATKQLMAALESAVPPAELADAHAALAKAITTQEAELETQLANVASSTTVDEAKAAVANVSQEAQDATAAGKAAAQEMGLTDCVETETD